MACASHAEVHGAYGFFQNQNVTATRELRGQQAGNLQRMSEHELVLYVGDTTFLNYSGQRATSDLGPHTSNLEHGFLIHALVAFSPRGLYLGTLHWQWCAPDPAMGQRQTRHLRPIEERKSLLGSGVRPDGAVAKRLYHKPSCFMSPTAKAIFTNCWRNPARPNYAARTAQVELRFGSVQFLAPPCLCRPSGCAKWLRLSASNHWIALTFLKKFVLL